MARESKSLIWLLAVPPAAAIAMGALMLVLALDSDPGVIEVDARPLSKTSWRSEPEQVKLGTPVPVAGSSERGAP